VRRDREISPSGPSIRWDRDHFTEGGLGADAEPGGSAPGTSRAWPGPAVRGKGGSA
jgi:hypothetical protein